MCGDLLAGMPALPIDGLGSGRARTLMLASRPGPLERLNLFVTPATAMAAACVA